MATLTAFIKSLDTLGAVAFAELKQEVARGGLQLIERGFQTETDPYGVKWKFSSSHAGHQGILWDSGTLKNGWRGVPYVGGVSFINSVVYANKQNYTRPMVPSAARGLPTAWRAMIARSFTKIIKQTLKESL